MIKLSIVYLPAADHFGVNNMQRGIYVQLGRHHFLVTMRTADGTRPEKNMLYINDVRYLYSYSLIKIYIYKK